jgi:hypothetical protein
MEVQDEIWKRSVSEPLPDGSQIDFLTIKRRPINTRAEHRMVSARIDQALANGMIQNNLLFEIGDTVQREYRRSLVTVEHSDTENGTWGSCSTRRQVQEIAAVCKNASAAANRVLQRRPAGPERSDPLRVLVPESYCGLLLHIDYGFPHLFSKFGDIKVLAFLWHPLGRTNGDMRMLMRRRQPFLRTVYLLDLNRPLRINVREFARLKINAGPWFGHWFAFVDLESNSVDDLVEYLKHESDEDRRAIIYEVAEVQQGFEVNLLGPPTLTKVRILTPVVISVN